MGEGIDQAFAELATLMLKSIEVVEERPFNASIINNNDNRAYSLVTPKNKNGND